MTEVSLPHNPSSSASPPRPESRLDAAETEDVDSVGGDEGSNDIEHIESGSALQREECSSTELGDGLASWIASVRYITSVPLNYR